jgi:hypothetical protein
MPPKKPTTCPFVLFESPREATTAWQEIGLEAAEEFDAHENQFLQRLCPCSLGPAAHGTARYWPMLQWFVVFARVGSRPNRNAPDLRRDLGHRVQSEWGSGYHGRRSLSGTT